MPGPEIGIERDISRLVAKKVMISHHFLSYTDRYTVSRTLGASAEKLEAGKSSPSSRETTSAVYHVVSGSGHSKINGEMYSWKANDTFSIPSWYKYQHFADDRNDVYLYRCDDLPLIKALGFYRAEGMDIESLVAE